MNDQSQLMNPPLQMMNKQPHMLSQQPPPMLNQQQQQAPMMSQPQVMNQTQLVSQSQMLGQSQALPPPPMMMNNRAYKGWPQQPSSDPNKKFQKSNFSTMMKSRSNWNYNKRKDQRRMDKPLPMPMSMPNSTAISGPTAIGGGGGGGYKPPTLNELQSQNRLKAKKFYPKRKFNNRFAPYAPRNTTSFIIRAKKSGGIASLVSPCPVTPAVLPTPMFSPSREVLGDMAKEEWGVDGYGSMKGLIRLRSPGHDAEVHDEDEDEEGGSSGSDVEEHVEVERRLDHDLSRFEMIYPSYGGDYNNVLENRVDDQDSHIAQLEEENLTLKERLFLMERELADLRRRMQFLERQNHVGEYVNEEVVENGSENESEGGSDVRAAGEENNEEMVEYVSENGEGRNANVDVKEEDSDGVSDRDVYMEEHVAGDMVAKEDELKGEVGNKLVAENLVVKDDSIKDEEAGNKMVAEEDMTVKEDDLKDEEARNKFVVEERIANTDDSKDGNVGKA